MTSDLIRVLAVDDDRALLELLKTITEETGEFIVTAISNPSEAIEIAAKERFDVIVCDYSMPGIDGIGLLKIFRAKHPKSPLILFTGVIDETNVGDIAEDDQFHYLPKGGDFGELMYLIKGVVAPNRQADMSVDTLRRQALLNQKTIHDWRNNETSINGYFGLMEAVLEEETDLSKVKETIGKYCRKCQTILAQNDLLRKESKTIHEINFSQPGWVLFGEIASELKRRYSKKKDLSFLNKIPNDIEMYVDKVSFMDIMDIFIDNSGRHGQRVSRITLSFIKDGGSVRLVYEDNGVGVVPENKEKIFQRGFGGNTGLGLYLARELMTMFGWTIVETGKFGEGAVFEVQLPSWGYRCRPEKE